MGKHRFTSGRKTGMGDPFLHRTSRLLTLAALVLALVFTLVPLTTISARAQQDQAEAKATVRVVHAVPGVESVDVLVDGQPVLERLAYGSASEYLPISAERHPLQNVPTRPNTNTTRGGQ